MRPFALALAFFMLMPPLPADAVPTVSLHWGVCPFTDPSGHSWNRDPGSDATETITITATGLSGSITALQLSIGFQSPFSGLGDAWRFDPSGCEGSGRLHINRAVHGIPCPLLNGDHPLEYSAFELSEYSDPYWGTWNRGILKDTRVFDAVATDPEATYTLGKFEFEHGNLFSGPGSRPDSCGCMERRVCIALTQAAYMDGAQVEHAFAIDKGFLTWNDPYNSSYCPMMYGDLSRLPDRGAGIDTLCVAGPTPAHARSWGSIKASYRSSAR